MDAETQTETREHGWQDYAAGHRCQVCRQAWANYHRERKHRLGLATPRPVRFYEGPYGPHGLSQLGEQIVASAAKREKQNALDVLDRLVRQYGTAVRFPKTVN